jgi:hypothetical protein
MGTGYGGAYSGVGTVILWCSTPYVLLGLFVGLSIAFRFKEPAAYIAMFLAILIAVGVLVSVFGPMVIIGVMAAPYGFFAGLVLSLALAAPVGLFRHVRGRSQGRRPL